MTAPVVATANPPAKPASTPTVSAGVAAAGDGAAQRGATRDSVAAADNGVTAAAVAVPAPAPALRKQQGAARKSAVPKAGTPNMLNAPAVSPTTRHELDLMTTCVLEARAAKSGGGTVWAKAEQLYFRAYLLNAAAPEHVRQVIHGPTTAERIKSAFEDYATSQKAFLVASSQQGSCAAPFACAQPLDQVPLSLVPPPQSTPMLLPPQSTPLPPQMPPPPQ